MCNTAICRPNGKLQYDSIDDLGEEGCLWPALKCLLRKLKGRLAAMFGSIHHTICNYVVLVWDVVALLMRLHCKSLNALCWGK